MDARSLETARELEARDAELGAQGDRLRALAATVDHVRDRATAVEAFFAAYPAEETKRRAARAEADEELSRRRAEAARAAEAVAEAQGEEERETAERAAARTAAQVELAESRLARTTAEEAELEREAADLEREVEQLEEQAHGVELPDLPPTPKGLQELQDWASRARANLFVAQSRIDAQRENVIREANELGTATLGEPVYGGTPEQIRRRIEATIGDATPS